MSETPCISLSDDQYNRYLKLITAFNEKQIRKGVTRSFGPSGATKRSGKYGPTPSVEVAFENGEWHIVIELLGAEEMEGKKLNPNQLALMAYANAHTRRMELSFDYALRSIQQDATQLIAYCALAVASSRKMCAHQAQLWISLASTFENALEHPEYLDSLQFVNYSTSQRTYSSPLRYLKRNSNI